MISKNDVVRTCPKDPPPPHPIASVEHLAWCYTLFRHPKDVNGGRFQDVVIGHSLALLRRTCSDLYRVLGRNFAEWDTLALTSKC